MFSVGHCSVNHENYLCYNVKHHQPLNVSSSCMVIWRPIHTGQVSPGDLMWIRNDLPLFVSPVQAKTILFTFTDNLFYILLLVTSTFHKCSSYYLASTAYQLKLLKSIKTCFVAVGEYDNLLMLLTSSSCPLSHQAAVQVSWCENISRCETNR